MLLQLYIIECGWRAELHATELPGLRYVAEEFARSDVAGRCCYFGVLDRFSREVGNLVFRKSARNFNPVVATCGKVTVAEVEQIVPVGTLDPDQVHTSGIYVQRLILAAKNEKRIEKRTTREGAA